MNIHQKLRIGLISALVLLMGLGAMSQRRIKASLDRAALVAHTHDVLAALDEVSVGVGETESDERAYLLAPAEEVAVAFDRARAATMNHLAQLRAVTADDPQQQRRIDLLQPLVAQELARNEAYMAAARANRPAAVAQYALTAAQDRERMRQIDGSLLDLKNEVQGQRQQRTRFSRDASALASVFDGAGTLFGIGFVALCGLWISRDLHRCEDAEAALRQGQEGLEARVEERTADLSKSTASLEAEIAERRNTEAQLQDSELRYRLLFQDSPLPMEVFDPETFAYLAVNKEAAELYGYSPEEFLHMTLLDIRPPEEVTSFLQFLETVKNVDSYSGTFATRHKSGKTITIEARVRTIEFGGRKVRLSLMTDVSEKKRLETHLQQAQKMDAIGRLAGGVAHDFNNLLMVILGYSDSILHKLDDADPIRAKVSEIHAAGQRAANLTSQLLAFSRKQILQMQTVQLNGVVTNISQMLRRLLGEDIEIVLNLDEELGEIMADPTQLEQVILNLSVNSRDAMPRGGQLTIETRNIELDSHQADRKDIAAGKYVQLLVSDTGSGMDEATRSRIFEPFFTTKDVGKGTGLGLSMVLGGVQQSGGAVTVDSEVGLGTTFKIYLPRLEAPVTPVVEEPVVPDFYAPVSEREATILLVEDEKQLRKLAREVLKEAGYTVIEASNGNEALRVAETLTSPPSLLLTDVVMPEMGGLELAEALQKKWPRLAIIYTSGYTEHGTLGGNLRPDVPFLQKPYMPGQLLEQVAQVLECERWPVVLIVDDDEDVRIQLRTNLERSGYRVIEAGNGDEAMRQVGSQQVKLVITDLFMPEKDGLELISELRKSRPDIKILALSGAQSGTFLKLASTLGADVVLPKPFLQEQVMEMAEALLA